MADFELNYSKINKPLDPSFKSKIRKSKMLMLCLAVEKIAQLLNLNLFHYF